MASMEKINKLDKNKTVIHNGWGIDKRIPITFILVVIVQTMVITWGAATLASDVKNYGGKIVKLERDFSRFVEKADSKYELIAVHRSKEESFKNMIHGLESDINHLKTRIEHLEQRK